MQRNKKTNTQKHCFYDIFTIKSIRDYFMSPTRRHTIYEEYGRKGGENVDTRSIIEIAVQLLVICTAILKIYLVFAS